MTFKNNTLEYRVTLDTTSNLFIAYDKNDPEKLATGITIERAIEELSKIS